MPAPDPLVADVEAIQQILIERATTPISRDSEYVQLRSKLIANPLTKEGLPRFVHSSRSLSQFWQFIKSQFDRYAERRQYIWGEFQPLLQALESRPGSPVHLTDGDVLAKLNSAAVQLVWQRALERRIADPEGAITSARTLLESVCKHILDDFSIEYDEKADLPKLYYAVSTKLNIAPSQHTEQVFKQILGGCASVVEGIGAMRNRLGDAHGSGSRRVRPAARHAQLAVNLAGSMTMFLVATWEELKKKGK